MPTFEDRKKRDKRFAEIPDAEDYERGKQENYVVREDTASEADGYGCREFNVKKPKLSEKGSE